MIISWIVAVLALGAAGAAGAWLLQAVPSRGRAAGGSSLPSSLPAPDAARVELAALLPSGDALVGAAPPISAAPLLEGVQSGAANKVDLALVGVRDDSDATDRELWLAAQRVLTDESSRAGNA